MPWLTLSIWAVHSMFRCWAKQLQYRNKKNYYLCGNKTICRSLSECAFKMQKKFFWYLFLFDLEVLYGDEGDPGQAEVPKLDCELPGAWNCLDKYLKSRKPKFFVG